MIAKRGAHKAVLEYLQTHQATGLTSMEAIEMFGVTRLSAIIYNLRKDHKIDTVPIEDTTRFGEHTTYGRYYYRGVKEDGNESVSN